MSSDKQAIARAFSQPAIHAELSERVRQSLYHFAVSGSISDTAKCMGVTESRARAYVNQGVNALKVKFTALPESVQAAYHE